MSLIAAMAPPAAAQEGEVIRLEPRGTTDEDEPLAPNELDEPRRGFDYHSFESRLESLWFQRKAFLADGRDEDASRQSRAIRDFCLQEGISRLEDMSGALIAEAQRLSEQGDHAKALQSLELAQRLDPGRPQVHAARAAVLLAGGRQVAAFGEWVRALRAAIVRSTADFSLFNRLALVVVVAAMLGLVVFSLLMLLRYQTAFRHEIEEWAIQIAGETWARPAGWAALLLPLLVWVAAGWAALYWIVITFRFMRRSERLAAVSLLLACVAAVPAWRLAAAVYSTTADPVVRTTLAAARGGYDPDRIVELRQLVRAYPEDPVYHFLLGGLYRGGRYFEEAFAEYTTALQLDPTLYQASINIGNIFQTTGQYDEAIANYNRALELRPDSLLGWYNLHLAQSESFRFTEAEESLNEARRLDADRLADLLSANRDSATVSDASLELASVWGAALAGRDPSEALQGGGAGWLPRQFLNLVSLVAGLALLGCGVAAVSSLGGDVARRCIRCGRPFCHYCKSGRQGREYCSQCLHLYVLGDGLAPETKTRKLYEVARYERLSRAGRRLVSLLLPGSGQVLRGKAGRGAVLLVVWLAALAALAPRALAPLEWFGGVDLPIELVTPGSVPAIHGVNAVAAVAAVAMLLVWVGGNAWHLRRRDA